MIPDGMPPAVETPEEIRAQRDRYAAAIANVTVYTKGRMDVTGEEIAALIRGWIPDRLRGAS